LGAVTRLDTLLLSAPVLAAMAWRAGVRAAWRPVLVGSLPLIAWECFAVLYYGFPLPNTAYAKLGGGIPQSDRTLQGWLYLLDSIERDPVTMVVIAAGMVAPVLTRQRRDWPVSLGLFLMLLYTVRVGGDFMSGRFLTGGVLCALMLLTREVRTADLRGLAPLPIALAVVASGFTPGASFVTDGRLRDAFIDRERPGDERRVNYPFTGLMSVSREGAGLTHPWARQARDVLAQGERVVEWGAAGIFGFTVGREVHIVDHYGLGDAFLARLPAQRRWYPGHIKRTLPWGYLETIASGHNRITDPALAMYYEQIRLVTRDRIWSPRRLRAIWRLNIGSYDHLTTSPR
jgi:arabinofuranosyltransferase